MDKIKSCDKKTVLTTIILIALLGIAVFVFRDNIVYTVRLLIDGNLQDIIDLIRSWGIFAPLMSILLMVFQAFLAPIPSFLITGANGVVFGFAGGVVVSWIGAMAGAAFAFYLARFFGEKFIKYFGSKGRTIEKAKEISENHGFKVVLIARLIPIVSFDLISYAAGLGQIKQKSFFIATGVGMIPGTIAYVLLGNALLKYSFYTSLFMLAVLIVYIIHRIIKKKSLAGKGDSSENIKEEPRE